MKKINLSQLGFDSKDMISHEEKKGIVGGRDVSGDPVCWSYTYVECMDDCRYAGGNFYQCDTYCYAKADEFCGYNG